MLCKNSESSIKSDSETKVVDYRYFRKLFDLFLKVFKNIYLLQQLQHTKVKYISTQRSNDTKIMNLDMKNH